MSTENGASERMSTDEQPFDFQDLRLFESKEIDLSEEYVIISTDKSRVYRFKDIYAVSLSRDFAEKEIRLMKTLEGISIPVLGIVMDGSRVDGYVMPLAGKVPTDVDLSTKRDYMAQMINLVERLHEKGFLHGDLKLANFLMCSDGRIRLCDFEEAQRIDEATAWPVATPGYRPPWRVINEWRDQAEVLSLEDDYYGLGSAIWELFTGHRVFEDIDTVEAENEVIPNLVIIDVNDARDPEAIETIWTLLEKGGRGTVNRFTSVLYKVTGPAWESMNPKEHDSQYQERKLRRYAQASFLLIPVPPL
jgi:serine/threonine protein kinase